MSESAEKTSQEKTKEKIAQLKNLEKWTVLLPALAVLFALLSIPFGFIHGGVPGWYSWWVRIVLVIVALIIWLAVCIVCDARIKRHKKRLRKLRQYVTA